MDQDRSIELGLGREAVSERSFLSQVYFWMAMGLGLTGLVAGWMAMNPSLIVAFARNSGLFLILAIVQLGLVFWLSSQIMNLSVMTATVGFAIYGTLNGILLSTIFLVYTTASIASTFLVTAGMFGAVSLYGFVTRRDLTGVGSLAFMGLIGIILASLVNWFLRSPALDWLISYIGIAVFMGLTAYDTQKLKQIHRQGFASGDMLLKIALLGALTLYLDFINLFLSLLRVLGRRK